MERPSTYPDIPVDRYRAITLLGRGESGKYCPFNTEVWGANNVYTQEWCRRLDKIFAFDDIEIVRPIINYAKKAGIPVVSWQKYATEHYPLQEIATHFKSDYILTTIDHMIAYAIYQKFEMICMWGFDVLDNGAYFEQKARAEYWLGRAQGAGIEVIIPPYSQLLKRVHFDGRKKVFQDYLHDIETKFDQTQQQISQGNQQLEELHQEVYRIQGDHRTAIDLMERLGVSPHEAR